MNNNIVSLCLAKVMADENISMEQAIELTRTPDKEALYAAANAIRKHYFGNRIDLCTIMNARSGRCSENCKWCAQSAHHITNVEIYDLINHQEAIDQARTNEASGAHKFSFVTSGRTLPDKYIDALCRMYQQIGNETTLTLCASMGLLNKEQLKRLAASGVKHYHCNIETAPSFFGTLCSTHTIEEKIATLKAAREVGMELCSGGIIGMGETMEQRVEMAITLQQIGVESIPINLLNPIEGTPLQGTPPLSDPEILTTFAVFRFVCPKAWLRFAGGRLLMQHIQDKALQSGINAALIGDLLTTVGSSMREDVDHFHSLGYEC